MKSIRIVIGILLIICLISVRRYEEILFYDPLLPFFRKSFMRAAFPDINLSRHILSMTFRYALNTILSLCILYVIFLKKKILRFSTVFYILMWILLTPLYVYFVQIHFNVSFIAGFYVQRFLMQPIFLFVLIPALLYQTYQEKKK